jgi:hypothetical protein
MLRGVQFNPKPNEVTLKEELLASLGVAAGRLEYVTKEIPPGPSIDASADQIEKFAQGRSKGLTFQEMTHNVRALFLSNAHDLPKTPATSAFRRSSPTYRHSLVSPQRSQALAWMFPESARGCMVKVPCP